MRNRCTKQRKDAIAQRLRHIAIIPMDGVHHELQRGVNNRSGVFGVKPFNQRGRAFQVRKQGGNGFALTVGTAPRFHRGLFGQDTLGQVWRGVTRRRLGLIV